MLVSTDFLIVGSGVAGLRAAIALADVGDVLVLTKADPGESNTGYAQGGVAAAVGPDDSPELHGRDTMDAGDGLCRRVVSADLDGRVLPTEPSYCRHAFVAGGQRVRAQDMHLAAHRDLVPQLFDLNGGFDVSV